MNKVQFEIWYSHLDEDEKKGDVVKLFLDHMRRIPIRADYSDDSMDITVDKVEELKKIMKL